jgi:hypothetical protein
MHSLSPSRKHLFSSTIAWLLAVTISFLAPIANSQVANERFKLSPAEKRQFVVENIFNYTRQEFDPPVVVQQIKRTGANYSTPEDAFISHVSAMISGDYDWWLSGWTADAQNYLKAQDQKLKRTPENWKTAWSGVLSGKQVVLLERLETGPYTILVYSLRTPPPDGKETFRSLYAARIEAGRWLATQELENDPFFFHYLEGKDKITVTSR